MLCSDLCDQSLLSSNDRAILEASELLVRNYSSDISPGLGPQLLRLKLCFSTHMTQLKNIRELAETLIIKTQVATSFPDVRLPV